MTTEPVDPGPLGAGTTTACGLALGAAATRLDIVARPLDTVDFLRWWETVGTGPAAIEIIRLASIAIAGWLVALGLLGLAASTRAVVARRVWRRLTPALLQRAMATTLAVGVAASPPPAGAQPGGPADGVPVLVDLGPAADDRAPADPPSPAVSDLGPIERPPRPVPSASPSGPDIRADHADTWVVEPGDHLWSIAAQIRRDRGHDDDTAGVARYWRRLIDDNRDAIGPDVDLIHPGLVLRLPADTDDR